MKLHQEESKNWKYNEQQAKWNQNPALLIDKKKKMKKPTKHKADICQRVLDIIMVLYKRCGLGELPTDTILSRGKIISEDNRSKTKSIILSFSTIHDNATT